MGKIGRKCRGKSELSKDSHRIDTASKLFVLPLLSTLVEPCCCRRTCWSLIYAIASCCCCCCCWPSCPCLCVPKDFRGLTFDPITMPGTRHQSRLPPIDHRPSIFQSHCQLYFSFGRIGSVLFMIIFYGLLYLITRAGVGRTTITKSASGDNTNVGT